MIVDASVVVALTLTKRNDRRGGRDGLSRRCRLGGFDERRRSRHAA
jgi:hypothetical protein